VHGAWPNASDRPRVAQFVRGMRAGSVGPLRVAANAEQAKDAPVLDPHCHSAQTQSKAHVNIIGTSRESAPLPLELHASGAASAEIVLEHATLEHPEPHEVPSLEQRAPRTSSADETSSRSLRANARAAAILAAFLSEGIGRQQGDLTTLAPHVFGLTPTEVSSLCSSFKECNRSVLQP
jgi:hypothetical protein